MIRYLCLLFLLLIPSVFSLTFSINESQDIIIDGSKVQIVTSGSILIENITSEIFDITIQKNNIFEIDLNVNESNSTKYTYSLEAVIPLSFYNIFKNTGETFLEHTTNFDIQTHREVSLTKFDRDINNTYSSRDIKVEATNPTNYSQIVYINLIKTRPNQVNDFRNQLYLLTMYELTLTPFETKSLVYKDVLSEIGDSYFIDYSIETLPEIHREISSFITYEQVTSSSSNSGSLSLLLKELIITKTITPEIFRKGDIVTISYTLSNPNAVSMNGIILEDQIHSDFIFTKNPQLTTYVITENFLPFETKKISYELEYVGTDYSVILIPRTKISYFDKEYYSNPITVYPTFQEEIPQLLIEKILSPLENSLTLVQIFITNIGNKTIDTFTLEDQNKEFYIPELKSKEQYLIEYQTQEIDYSHPKISENSNLTTSIIINDRISTTHSTTSKIPYYSTALIVLAGILLLSDIIV